MKKRRLDLWRRITAIGLVAVLCLTGEGTTSLAAKKTESANESIESATAKTIQLAKTEGKVSVSNASGKGVTVIKNMRLLDGYKVTTEKESYAWAELDKAKLIKADAVSEVSVRKNKKILEVFLESGNMFFNVTEPLSDDETMNICTSSMIAGIRGTCGWVRVINKMCTRIYLLEGKLECTVIDPVTGQAKMILLKAGEWADFYVYDKDHKGDKCDIIQDKFVREDVPGFVLVELVGDNKRCEEIFQDSGIDLRNLTKAEAAQRLAEDEEATGQKLASIEAAAMLLASHISQDPVWVSDPDRPILVSNPAKPAQTPVVTPAPAATPIVPAATTAETPASSETPAEIPETPEEQPNPVQNVDVQENPDVVEELLAEGNDITVTSDPTSNVYQIDSDLTIPAGTTMTIEEDLTLVVGSGATVTVDGTLLAMGNVENNGKIIINSGESVHVNGDLANFGTIINQNKGRMEVKDGIDNYGDIVCDGESTMYSSSPEGTVRMISDSSTLVISGGDITNESDGAALALEEASQIGNVTFTTQTLLQSVSENVLTVGGKQLTVDRFDVSKNDSEYYQFKIEIKSVSFQPNGGNLSKNVKVITGFPVGSGMPAPTRAGYELIGWNTEADGSGTEFTKETVVDENIIVYAQWKETNISHTIVFNANGGTMSGDTTVKILRNGMVTLPTPAAPEGYSFYGWYTAPDSTGVKVTGSEPITADSIYYARWVPATAAATVTFQINDGSGATTAIQSVAVGNVVSTPPTPAREGYTFGGWYTDQDCTNAYDFSKPLTASTVFYAKWDINNYTVTFDTGSGGSSVASQGVDYNHTMTMPPAPTKTGYTFAGWYKDSALTESWNFNADTVTGATTVYAKWNINNYTVSFDTGAGGSAVADQGVDYDHTMTMPPTPTKKGYSFAGWYKDTALTESWDFGTDTVTEATTLYASWTINRYTVNFDTGAGGSAVASQGVDYDRTMTMPPTPTRTGYTFAGWYADADLTRTWDFGADTVTEDTTIYAKWDINSYTVSFDTGAGGSAVADQGVDYDHTMTMPPTPTRTGYTFAGWYKDTALTESWDFGTDTVTEAITLYASWTINQYTVSFDTGAGGSTVADQGVDYDHTMTMPPTPTRTGYTFAGWYKEEALINEWDFAVDTVTDATTLYAKWTINSYTVSFDTGDGGSAVEDQGVDYDHTITAPPTPTRIGYTFVGWYKDAALTESWDFGADTVTGATTLYAKWDINRYTLNFDANGGSSVASQSVNYQGKATVPSAPTRTGYTFAGWYRDTALTSAWDFTNDTVTGATTLYAKWAINRYTVAFDTDGGSAVVSQAVEYSAKATEPMSPTRIGYTFGGWYKESALMTAWDFGTDAVTADTTIYAKWNINNYTVAFDTDGGSAVADQTIEYNKTVTKPADPTRIGYTFGGWYKEAALTNAWDFGADTVTADTTLYAKWTINRYTVTFSVDGGSAVAGQTAEYNAKATVPTAPTKTGYTFNGWYKEAALNNTWNFATDVVTADTTLYAKWEAISYTVQYNTNGGSTVADQTVNYDEKATKPADPAKTGYTFGGWYKEASLTNAWDFTTDTIAGDTTLYAKWNVNFYTVTFNTNGGSTVAPQDVDYNEKATEPTVPTRTGYTFAGWYKEAALTNAWDFTTDVVIGNTDLYAKWNINSYTVTFDVNGGSAVVSQTVEYSAKVTEPTAPTKTGYTFIGWYKEATLTNAWDFTADAVIGDTTIYAKWSINSYTVIFSVDGGSAVASQTVEYSGKVTAPTAPTKTGYTFVGWYKEATLTNAWDFTADAVIGDTTIYAKWNINSYMLTFHTGADASTIDPASVQYNHTAAKPADPTKTGYTFAGWYKEETCATAWNFTTDKVTGDTTIYAKWNINSYTVTFSADGGSSVASQTVEYNAKATTPTAPTKTGYTFGGWYKEATLTNAWDFTADVVTGDTTIYAKWNINSYTVTFETNGGSSVASQTVDYQEKATEPTAPTRTGYDFAGWYRDTALTGAWNFAADTVTAATTLYAKWEKKEYTVTFHVDGGSAVTAQTVKYEEKATKPADPTKTGHTFAGWYKEETLATAWDFAADQVTGNTTIYAKWTVNKYTVTFDTGTGASAVDPVSVEYNKTVTKPTDPTRTGYTFGGWYKEETLATAWDFAADKVTAATTLYAKWTINTYTVIFELDGGSTNAETIQSVDYDKKATKPEEPTKAGYVFDGWYKETGLENEWDFAADTVKGNMTLYAKWMPKLGDFAVSGGVFQTDYDYDENEHVLNILTAEKLTIRNVDPATATADRIEVAAGVSADITLAGVNIDTSSLASAGSTTEIVPLSLSSAAGETIKITLAAGRTNTLKGAEKGMQDAGSGTLSIVGAATGALTVTGSDYGIYSKNSGVEVADVTLTVNATGGSGSHSLQADHFTLHSGTVYIGTDASGAAAEAEYGFRGAAFTAEGGTLRIAAMNYGMYEWYSSTERKIAFSDTDVTIISGNYGIYTSSTPVSAIRGALSVSIDTTSYAYGIYCNTFTAKDVDVVVDVKTSSSGSSYGIYTNTASGVTGDIVYDGGTMNVNVVSTSTSGSPYTYGIYASSGTITFDENTKSVHAEGGISGIYAKALMIKGGEITAISADSSMSYSSKYGIYVGSGGNLQIEGSSTVVNATAAGRYGYGIYSYGGLVIDGSTVTAISSADDSSSYGIYAYSGTEFVVKGDTANVTAKGGGYGIQSYIPITVDGGTVTAVYTGTGSSGYGIYSSSTINIGQNVKKIVANGLGYGLYGPSGIQIAGGEVEATATGTYGYGINSYGPVVISGGSVSIQAVQCAVYGSTVTMTGGEVTATASNSNSTIRGGSGSVISGGVVRVNYDGAAGGNAFDSSVSVQPGAKGLIVFENGAGKVYGDTVLTDDFEVASVETLALTKDPSGPDVSLTVPEGLTMTNNGVVTIGLETQLIVNGLLINNGVINNSGVALSDPKDWADVYSGTGEWRGTPGGVVPSYTVTFQENGGNTVSPQTVAFGGKAAKPADPAKTGFIFDGWYVDETCLTEYDFDTPVRKNIILYARWAELNYTVTFDANGGTFAGAGTTSTQVVDYGKKVKELASEDLPVKTGYLVEGWYKDAACTEKYDFDTLVKREITIYAKWKIQTFTVTFVDASTVLEEETVNYNEKATVPTEPTKTGYLFANWCEDSACTTPYDFRTAVTKNLTLYANWAKLTGSFAVAGGVEGVDYEYDSVNQILNIKSAKTLTLQNEDASTAAADRIQVEPGVAANIILAGVNIDVSGVAISASSSAGSSVNITLASGTTNILKGSVGLQDTGSGALNIGGNGTLDTTGTTYGIEASSIHVNGGILFVNGGRAAGSSAIIVNPASGSGAVVFENNMGKVYGDLTLEQDMVIAADHTLIIPNGVTLTIASGKTLTNNGAVIVENGGTLSGTVVDNGTMMDNGAVSCGASASGQSALAPYRGDITSVVFKSGVTSISANCFENCTGLTSVEIPSGVTTIGASAFAGCTGLTSAEIPSTVTTINASAFAGCTNLTKISSLYNVDYIRDYAFKDCNSLVGVIIPTYTGATVGTGVFPETTELYYGKTSGNRKPSWVSNYSSNPFFFMESTSTNTYWNYTNGVLTIAGTGNMGNYTSSTYTKAPWYTYRTSITSIVIREGVTSVGNCAFYYGYSALENVTLADSITSIGESAFYSCSKITNITIPEGVTSIGASAFSSCSGLTSVTIPGSVTSIGKNAFYSCSKLTGVTIPEGVTSIGASAFYYCSKLTSVTIPSSVTSMGTNVFEGCSGLTSVTITEGVTTIWESAFNGCSSLTSVTIPSSVTSIGASAFKGCKGLTGITIPKGVTSIGASAFSGCSGLTGGVTIPNSVTSIGASAFYGCSGLTGVWLEDGIQISEIGASWFSGCSKITEFCYSSEAGTGKFAIPTTVTTIGAGAFSECESLTGTLDIPDGVVSIGNNAFRGMKGITGVVIPSGTTLGKNLFYGTPLETAEFKSGRTEIPEGLFKRYDSSNYVTKDTYLKTVILPDTIQIIGKEAFYQNTALTSITLPDGVTTIGDHAFYNCSLEELTIPSSVTTIGKNAFEWNKNLTTLTVGSEQIGEKAFQNCDALTSITFLDTVRSIGTSAFEKLANNPSGALTIDFGHGVQTIGDRAFCNRRTMTSLTIPASVTSIGVEAFYSPYSTALTELVIEEGENPLTIGESAFYHSTNLVSLVLPDRVTSIGNNAFNWSSGGMVLTDLTIGSGLTSLPANAFDTSKLTYIKWKYLDSGSGEVTEYIYETDAATSAFEKFRAEYIAKGCTVN